MAKKKDDEKVVPMESPPPKEAGWTDEEFVRQLEDIMYKNIRERLGPVLDTYFAYQRDQIAEIMSSTISRCYKVMLEHTMEERQEALAELKEDDDDEVLRSTT